MEYDIELHDDSNLLEQAQQEFPVLKDHDIGFKYSEGKAPFMMESWSPGMTESIPGVNRPKEIAPDKFGVEVYDPHTRPIDIAGDIVSHHLVDKDPTIKEAYKKFADSIEPWQENIMKEQHQHAKDNYGEERSFEDWKKTSGLPAYFRGHPFKQWSDTPSEKMYTPEQIKHLDGMMNYLRGK